MKSSIHLVKWTRSCLKGINRELFDGPVVKTLSSHCRGRRIQSLVKELRSHKPWWQKNMYIYYIYVCLYYIYIYIIYIYK